MHGLGLWGKRIVLLGKMGKGKCFKEGGKKKRKKSHENVNVQVRRQCKGEKAGEWADRAYVDTACSLKRLL